MILLGNADNRVDQSTDLSRQRRRSNLAVFSKKNSGKQRQNSGRFAVISVGQAAKAKDFRQKYGATRCKFPAITAENSEKQRN
jgi:hypothetical protein